jgi:hypothetical protein
VVDRVEGFGCIEEENELLDVVCDSLEEEGVEMLSVRVAASAIKKALLSRVEQGCNSGHDGAGDNTG